MKLKDAMLLFESEMEEENQNNSDDTCLISKENFEEKYTQNAIIHSNTYICIMNYVNNIWKQKLKYLIVENIYIRLFHL